MNMDMSIESLKEYIAKVHWKEAKTYSKTAPHEYTIREWRKDIENEFEDVVRFIRIEGEPERFFSKTYIYYYIGNYKYWTMGDPVEETVVLNRALISDNEKQHV